MISTILAQQDSFAPFDDPHHHGPPVPEPRWYGFFLLTLLLAFVLWRRIRRSSS